MKSSETRTVVHVLRRFVEHQWGGTESVLAALAREQAAAGARPEIFTSMALSNRREERIEGVPVRRFPYCYPFFGLSARQRRAMDHAGGNPLSWSLLAALLRKPAVRLFHVHEPRRIGGIVRTAARLRGLPYVVTLNGGIFDLPGDETAAVLHRHGHKMEWGRLACALLGSRRVLREADAVICVGRGDVERVRAHLGHDRVYHLPNGVDPARFAHGDGAAFRAAQAIPQHARVILCVSQYAPQKDQLLLVEAFERLAVADPALHLVLAGMETDAEYLAVLDRRIAVSSQRRRIRRLGALPRAGRALADAFSAADVFALASRHEPFGIVALEAWSAGVPVVASDVGGLRELIVPGETGLLFSPGHARACALAIHSMLHRPSLAENCAEAGQRLARARYAWSNIAGMLERIYQSAEGWHAHGVGRVASAAA